jgi:hypothetical protein
VSFALRAFRDHEVAIEREPARPIDMFPFLGARGGKVAVLEVVRQIAENFRVHRFDRQTILLGVDAAASMIRYSLTSLNPTSRSRFALRISRSSRPDG